MERSTTSESFFFTPLRLGGRSRLPLRPLPVLPPVRLAGTPKGNFAFAGNRVSRFRLPGVLADLLAAALRSRPDMKSATGREFDFPRAPNPFALAEAAVKHVVRAGIRLGPITLAAFAIVTTI